MPLLVFATVAWVVSTQAAFSAESPEVTRALRELGEENRALREQMDRQGKLVEELLEKVRALEGRREEPPSKEEPLTGIEPMRPGLEELEPRQSLFPTLSLRGFGDVIYRVGGQIRNGETEPNAFSLGELDLFATSMLSPKASVLSEIVFEYDMEERSSVSVERLQLQYQFNDLVNLRLGRTHTPFGYWNETFHHGAWFQTTALRPEMLRFHDGGSILPIHSVGLEVFGAQPLPGVLVEYSLGAANGRGDTYGKVQNIRDLNDHKAVYGVLSFSPDLVPGLKAGVNGYLDKIPPDRSVAARRGEIDEVIVGAHLAYLHRNIELLSELTHIRHDDDLAGRRYDTWGYYLQGAYQFPGWKPYYRLDYLDIGHGDPFYGPLLLDLWRHTVGVRWDPLTWVGLKLEYHYLDQPGDASAHGFFTQAAFTF